MIAPLTANTQAILLLTAPLEVGRNASSSDLLTLSEYNRLARLLRQRLRQPADLLGPDAASLVAICGPEFDGKRLKALLGRGFLLSQAVERWHGRAIWVISRADTGYPSRLKSRLKEDAPPILYGCGDPALLESGGVAVVGSRHVDDALLERTAQIGALIVQAGRNLVSGGARGIDQAAMRGASRAGGAVIGVLADSLERAALAREHREGIMDGRLVLTSPYDPAAGFNVGHAMQRNKLIYALADAALVISSDFNKGGTWAGAVEQLDKYHCGPLFVRFGPEAGKGNDALLRKGALPWSEPGDATALSNLLEMAKGTAGLPATQGALPLTLGEEPVSYGEETPSGAIDEAVDEPSPAPGANEENDPPGSTRHGLDWELRNFVRDLLRKELIEARTEEEVATDLGVCRTQAKAWLKELVKAGTIEKVKKSKPPRFRVRVQDDVLL